MTLVAVTCEADMIVASLKRWFSLSVTARKKAVNDFILLLND